MWWDGDISGSICFTVAYFAKRISYATVQHSPLHQKVLLCCLKLLELLSNILQNIFKSQNIFLNFLNFFFFKNVYKNTFKKNSLRLALSLTKKQLVKIAFLKKWSSFFVFEQKFVGIKIFYSSRSTNHLFFINWTIVKLTWQLRFILSVSWGYNSSIKDSKL